MALDVGLKRDAARDRLVPVARTTKLPRRPRDRDAGAGPAAVVAEDARARARRARRRLRVAARGSPSTRGAFRESAEMLADQGLPMVEYQQTQREHGPGLRAHLRAGQGGPARPRRRPDPAPRRCSRRSPPRPSAAGGSPSASRRERIDACDRADDGRRPGGAGPDRGHSASTSRRLPDRAASEDPPGAGDRGRAGDAAGPRDDPEDGQGRPAVQLLDLRRAGDPAPARVRARGRRDPGRRARLDSRRRGDSSGSRRAPAPAVCLATPETVDRLCYPLHTEGEVSCCVGSKVVVNLDRWENAVPHWDGSLRSYRRMLVCHEVGHRIGQGHRYCPGAGQLAPVMQQQTYGLQGCRRDRSAAGLGALSRAGATSEVSRRHFPTCPYRGRISGSFTFRPTAGARLGSRGARRRRSTRARGARDRGRRPAPHDAGARPGRSHGGRPHTPARRPHDSRRCPRRLCRPLDPARRGGPATRRDRPAARRPGARAGGEHRLRRRRSRRLSREHL